MPCPFKNRSIGALTLNASILTIIVYAIFFKWLDIPIMDYCYLHFAATSLATISTVLAKIFASKNWLAVTLVIFIMTTFRYYVVKCPRSKYVITWALGIFLAAILAEILKYGLARYRPVELIQQGLYGFHYFSNVDNYNSTPSGHSVFAFAGFYGFWRVFKTRWLGLLLIILAVIIGLSRIIITAHYPSDVILGAYVGILSVEWLQVFYRRMWGNINNA